MQETEPLEQKAPDEEEVVEEPLEDPLELEPPDELLLEEELEDEEGQEPTVVEMTPLKPATQALS